MATALCSRSSFTSGLCHTSTHNFSLVQSTPKQSTRLSSGPRHTVAVRSRASTGSTTEPCQEYASSTALDLQRRILGVGPDASKREVKAAYRKLALQFHPDVCEGDDCEVKFMEVNRAYESLMALPSSSSNQTSQRQSAGNGFPDSYGSGQSYGFHQEDESWKDFLQNLVNDSSEELREDCSSYYSNLKYYSKAGCNRRRYSDPVGSYQYCQGNW